MELEIIKNIPENNSKALSLLFRDGVNYGTCCWKEKFVLYFTSNGFLSYALSFSSHGNISSKDKHHTFSLYVYKKDILLVIKDIKERLLFIGHALRGAMVQKILYQSPENNQAVVLITSLPSDDFLKTFLCLNFTSFIKFNKLLLFSFMMKIKVPVYIFFLKVL